VEYDQEAVTPIVVAESLSFGSAPKVDFAAGASAKAYLKPSARVLLYGFELGSLGLEAYAKSAFDALPTPEASTRTGYSVNAHAFRFGFGLPLAPFGFDFKAGLSKTLKADEKVHRKWGASLSRFSASPVEGDSPLVVHFTDESKSGFNGIDGWQWDFGDGVSSTLQNPTHTYERKGVYTARLQVQGRAVTFLNPAQHIITVGEEPDDPPPPNDTDPIDDEQDTPAQSCDPNELAGPLGFGDPLTERYVLPGQWMDYIVYFENRSNATAAAQEVRVTNALSPYLDWSTFELGEATFNNQTEMGLAGRNGGSIEVDQDGTEYRVRVRFDLNPTNGVAHWYLRSVDPATMDEWPTDPYAGFLPPNDDTHRGEGHLAYRIRVRDDAPVGTRIDNSASIVFDYNAPIETDPAWFNTVAGDPPEVPTGPIPTNDAPALVSGRSLRWNVAGGATHYDVWLWRDGQPRPAQPLAEGLACPFASVSETLQTDTVYRWQVEASNAFGRTSGPEWTFTERALQRFAFSAATSRGGRILPGGTVPVWELSDQQFNIVPDLYWHTVDVLVNGVSAGRMSSYTFSNVTSTGSIYAQFAPDMVSGGGVDVPVWWLAANGWTTDLEEAARADSDGDGMTTWEEYQADTIPTQRQSRLAITGICRDGGDVVVQWQGGTKAEQVLESRTNGLRGEHPWQAVTTNHPPTPTVLEYQYRPPGVRQRFYRIRAWRTD